MPQKPSCKDDLKLPFNKIGEPGWKNNFENYLADYEVPLPEPCSVEDLNNLEKKLGFQLPISLFTFITEIGPLDFGIIALRNWDSLKILFEDKEIAFFRDWFDLNQQKQLKKLLAIGDYCSDAGVVAIDPASQICYLCQHDPLGIYKLVNSFDDLIKSETILLSSGYFGYPDPEIGIMTQTLVKELFGRS